jgi:hypothetical protein
MMEYMLWYNIERPHHSLNKKSPIAYFRDIINSNKSEFSQTGMTYTPSHFIYYLKKLEFRYNFKDNISLYKCLAKIINLSKLGGL